jgi:hypothetical protein
VERLEILEVILYFLLLLQLAVVVEGVTTTVRVMVVEDLEGGKPREHQPVLLDQEIRQPQLHPKVIMVEHLEVQQVRLIMVAVEEVGLQVLGVLF